MIIRALNTIMIESIKRNILFFFFFFFFLWRNRFVR